MLFERLSDFFFFDWPHIFPMMSQIHKWIDGMKHDQSDALEVTPTWNASCTPSHNGALFESKVSYFVIVMPAKFLELPM